MGMIQEKYNIENLQEEDSQAQEQTEPVSDEMKYKDVQDQFRSKEAEETISSAQQIKKAAETITEKLGKMEELAKKAASGEYTAEQVTEMQKEMKGLAEEVNDIVENTEYKGNKVFGPEGEDISISIGRGSSIEIAAKDLSIDASDIDLTADPEAAIEKIEGAISQSSDYGEYLEFQTERMEHSALLIEPDSDSKEEEIDKDKAMEIAMAAAKMAVEEIGYMFNIQANVDPDTAIGLLKEKEETSEGSDDSKSDESSEESEDESSE